MVLDIDHVLVHFLVMMPAQQNRVVDVGRSTGAPRQRMVDLPVSDCVCASRVSACSISGNDGPSLPGGKQAFFPSDIQNFASLRENDSADRRIANQARQLRRRQRRSVVEGCRLEPLHCRQINASRNRTQNFAQLLRPTFALRGDALEASSPTALTCRSFARPFPIAATSAQEANAAIRIVNQRPFAARRSCSRTVAARSPS